MKGVVVINKTSGKRSGMVLWRQLIEFFETQSPRSNPLAWPVLETDLDGLWENRLSSLLSEGCDTVVCVGGDGTLSSVEIGRASCRERV